MKAAIKQNNIRKRRVRRVRSRIFGTAVRPRVAFFRSNAANYAQAIDDVEMKTLVSASSREEKTPSESKSAGATRCGVLMAEKLKKAKVARVVFDRRGYKYHGRVKLFVEGLRRGGIRV